MKVTLNDSVPEHLRPLAEEAVRTVLPKAVIEWLPSRFPRLVMLVAPEVSASSGGSSIFEDDSQGLPSVGKLSAELETRITAALGKRG